MILHATVTGDDRFDGEFHWSRRDRLCRVAQLGGDDCAALHRSLLRTQEVVDSRGSRVWSLNFAVTGPALESVFKHLTVPDFDTHQYNNQQGEPARYISLDVFENDTFEQWLDRVCATVVGRERISHYFLVRDCSLSGNI